MFTTPKAKKELFLASSLCDGVEDNDIKWVFLFMKLNFSNLLLGLLYKYN